MAAVDGPELLAAADRNFVGAFEKLVDYQPDGEVRWFGPVFAFVSRIELSIFNGVIVLEPANSGDVEAASDWVRAIGVPHQAVIRSSLGDGIAAHLEARGYRRDAWLEPVMAIEPPERIPPPAAGVTVDAIEDEAALEDFIMHMVASGVPEPMARAMYPPKLVADPDVRCFVARLDGRPMGNSLAVRTGDTSGVYAVGTRAEARRRGVGTAATWAAVQAGRDWGCTTVVLQSSDMGHGVYARMGFREIDRLILLRG